MCRMEGNTVWWLLLSSIHSHGELPGGCGFAALFLQASLKETYRHGLIKMVCQRLHHLQLPCTLFVSVQEWHVHTFLLPSLSDFISLREATLLPAHHMCAPFTGLHFRVKSGNIANWLDATCKGNLWKRSIPFFFHPPRNYLAFLTLSNISTGSTLVFALMFPYGLVYYNGPAVSAYV